VAKVSDQLDLENSRVLVLGATGLLGTNVYESYASKFETVGTYFQTQPAPGKNLHRLDASNFVDIYKLVEELCPTVIVNCMGLANVETCESRPEANWKINAEIPTKIARLAALNKMKFVHISTDHFYSETNKPRSENDLMTPINQYGFAKLHAEKSILLSNPDSLVLRTNFFGHSGNGRRSILDFALNSLMEGREIKGFDDVVFSPVGIREISRFLISKNVTSAKGVLNFSSGRPLSKYEFMLLVARANGHSESQVLRSKISSSNLRVRRPSYLALDPRRLTNEFGYTIPTIELMLDEELAAIG